MGNFFVNACIFNFSRPGSTIRGRALFVSVLIGFICHSSAFSQGVIPTKGKDFWIGFPYSPGALGSNPGSKRCDVFITSEVNTSGVLSIPQQGWTTNFTVVANQTTTITIPVNIVEHNTSEVVENKGVEITSLDTVSVFAISFMQYTADGTVVYPKQSLGIEYRISSYKGISSGITPGINSELLIVATEDATQISITPTSPTWGGRPANVPFTINLNAGQSYQVLASNYNDDLTGTTIESTGSSGSCRPFAVFSGSTCVNIPTGCTACDILYDQAIPVPNWGKTYFAVPFSFATGYTIRILADQNNTTYTINGGAPGNLNAGQFIEVNNITGPQCITASNPVCVIQYMQGVSCASAGDPAMMYLNAQEQKIDKVTFSTVTSTVITQHVVNVIMNSAHIAQLTLDGSHVSSASFTTMPFCNNISYARLVLSQGSHTLAADSGFTAYAYGTGQAESYAYSVGSYSKQQPIPVDSILCTNDTLHIGTTNILNNPWWSTITNPNDTIAIGPVLTLTPPINPDIYLEHGSEFLSGCDKTYYFNIEIPDPPQTFVTASAHITCQNQTIQFNAGTIPSSSIYQYSWSPVTGLNNPTIANPVLTATSSMWYYVSVTSPGNCAPVVRDSIFIDVLSIPLPNVNGGGNQSVCPGTSAILSATGGITYSWSPGGATSNSISVSPSTTTDYIVFVTDSNGCSNSDTVSVNVFPSPNANAGANQSICYGNPASLSVTGGVSFIWNPGGSTNRNITVSPDTTTDYTVEITDANSCVINDTVTVTVNPVPVADAGTDQIICSATPITLTASGGISYLWTPGNATTSSIQVSPPSTTNYVVRVSDANNCVDYDTVLVTVFPSVSGTTTSQTMCIGETILLSDSGGISYLWNPGGSTNSSISVSPAASLDYTVKIITTNGCEIYDTVHVNVNSLPSAYAGNDAAVCLGDSASLSASGGTSYLWIFNMNPNPSIVITPDASREYIVMVKDNNGCVNYDSVYITVNPLPVADAGDDVIICPGTVASLNASGGQTYLWSPGGETNSAIQVSPALPTNYSVEVTDLNNCKNQDTVLVDLFPLPVPAMSVSSPACVNNQLIFSNLSLISAGTILQNDWNFGDGNSSAVQHASHAYNLAGNYHVRLVTTSDQGCVDSTGLLLTINQNPAVSFTTQSGCALQLMQFTDLSNALSGNINQWHWDFGDGESDVVQHPLHAYSADGTYDVRLIVSTDSGCTASRMNHAAVKIYPLPIAGFTAHPDIVNIIDPEIEFLDASSGGLNWNWNFGDGKGVSDLVNPSYKFSDTGTFNVRLILENTYGCFDTTFGSIYVEPFFAIYFPNAFTPNGDNKNDFFSPYGEGILELELFIYDRWGKEVFTSHSMSDVWDGGSKNGAENYSEGVYVYRANVTDYKRGKHEFTGSVTLVR